MLLGQPEVLPTLNLTVPASLGGTGTAFGINVGFADVDWIDAQFSNYMAAHPEITPSTFPMFMTYQTYLTQQRQLLYWRISLGYRVCLRAPDVCPFHFRYGSVREVLRGRCGPVARGR